MPAPTVTVQVPQVDARYFDPGLVRPEAIVSWTGGVGPFDVLHEWDDDSGFGTPITDLNASATSPDTGVPPSDLGPAGTDIFYRVRVTDTDDSTFTVSPTRTLTFTDPIDFRRHLYLLGNIGVGFDPIDTPGGGWGPDPDPSGGAPDGFAIDFRRHLYLAANVGVGFDPTDGGAADWIAGPPDGFTIDFRRHLYLLANVDTSTPTPHIWYLFPTFGREGWEFKIIGFGFGDTQGTHTGTARLNALAVGIISWSGVAELASTLVIDPGLDIAEPEHQDIRATVPTGGASGLVFVETDDV